MKKKKLTGIITLSLLMTCAASGCANPEKDGTEALEAGNYEEAQAQFTELSQSGDKEESAEGYRGLGMTYYEMEDYEKALSAFEQAEDAGVSPDVQLYNLMGVCGMQTGDYVKALEYIQAGLALADASSGGASEELIQEMKYNEIVCYEQQTDWENAKQKASEYLEDYPDDEAVQKEAEFLETR